MQELRRRLGRRGLSTFAVSGAILAAAAAPAVAVSAGTFKGTTSQHRPISLTIAHNKVKLLTIDWHAYCARSRTTLGFSKPHLLTYHRAVVLSATGWNTFGTYSAQSSNGYREDFTVRDHGKFVSANRIRGAFSGTVKVISDKTHKQVDTCRSGTVRFTLKRSA